MGSQLPADIGRDWDVIVCGAGPTGLTLANLLGVLGVRTLVVERLPALIDYPRGVGMDDESLRCFQAAGLVDEVRRHTVPNQILRFNDKTGRELAAIDPKAQPFGWPRRNGFVQPSVDRELAQGLARFAHVQLVFGQEIRSHQDVGDHVEVEVAPDGEQSEAPGASLQLRCRYLVGCDGGRSPTRSRLGLAFDGKSESTRWLVIDLANDPLGTPNAAFVLDDALPHVTMGLPHGVRRYEFMVPQGEGEEVYESREKVLELLGRVLPGVQPTIIRHRVYTHHARIASAFGKGRVLIGGDAAHLMPVWQGQGFNTGIRDASNMAWKLALAVRGHASAALLESYTVERMPHAAAMIDISVLTGQIFVPSVPAYRVLRNLAAPWLSKIGPLRRYIAEMRFKPMPFFKDGIVIHEAAAGTRSRAGRMFIQPRVSAGGRSALLDDVIGLRFAVLSWSNPVTPWLDDAASRLLETLGAQRLVVRPMCQLEAGDSRSAEAGAEIIVGDLMGDIKAWFDSAPGPIVILRPDRIVAANCQPWQLAGVVKELAQMMGVTSEPVHGATPGEPEAALPERGLA